MTPQPAPETTWDNEGEGGFPAGDGCGKMGHGRHSGKVCGTAAPAL